MNWRELPVPLWNENNKVPTQSYSESEKQNILCQLDGPGKVAYKKLIAKKSPTFGYHKLVEDGGNRLTSEEIASVNGARNTTPLTLYRVKSFTGYHRSSGLDGTVIKLPNAHVHQLQVYSSITHMTAEDNANVLCAHLLWKNPVEDYYLSFTNSINFYITHSHRRFEAGQRGVFVEAGNIKELQTKDGTMAPCYPANTLLYLFAAHKAYKLGVRERSMVYPHHYSHEYLVEGEARDPEGAMPEASHLALIEHGLYDLIPEVHLKNDEIRTRVYMHQVGMKNSLHYHSCATAITAYELLLATELAKLMQPSSATKPPLRIFLDHLAARKRPSQNPRFHYWVKEHYDGEQKRQQFNALGNSYHVAEDVRQCIHPDMHRIPENLPDVIQSVNLLQAAGYALGMGNVLSEEFDIIKEDNNCTYDEDRFRNYAISKPMNKIIQKLLHKCWYGNDEISKKKRESLALNWHTSGLLDDDGTDSSDDEDEQKDDMVEPENCSTAETERPTGTKRAASELLRMDEPTRKKAKGPRKGKPAKTMVNKGKPGATAVVKAAMLTDPSVKTCLRKLHKRANQIRGRQEARKLQNEAHAKFEDLLKPQLQAAAAEWERQYRAHGGAPSQPRVS